MPRYAAFLRGVMPTNLKMPELRACFEAAGFTEVKTVLSSGNVVFAARAGAPAALERKAEAVMRDRLGRSFLTIVRPIDALQALLASDPYHGFRLARFEAGRHLPAAPPVDADLPTCRSRRRADPARRRRRGLRRLRSDTPRPGLHDADREDVRRRGDDPHLGDGQ